MPLGPPIAIIGFNGAATASKQYSCLKIIIGEAFLWGRGRRQYGKIADYSQ